MTKRKSEEEKAAAKAKRRVPFSAPKDVATRAMYEPASTHRSEQLIVLTFRNGSITRNASSSPLLRLPLEIRNRIWALVLGNQFIHLEYLDTIRIPGYGKMQIWRHLVCQCDCPENEMVEEFTWTNRYGEEEIIWRQPHYSCDQELAYDIMKHHRQWNHVSMHLTALRVCRQIYIEANDVLWTTNTFSFNDAAVSFDRFMDSRTSHQRRSLKNLRLQMDWVWGEDQPWNDALNMTLIRHLSGLRSLRLQINHSMSAALYQEAKARGNELGLFQTRHLGFVHKMAILPLTNVEVFVGDRCQPQDANALWTAEDRMEYAEGIRKILLGPKGENIFA